MYITGNSIIDSDVSEIISEQLDWKYFAGKTVLITGANGMLPSYFVYTLIGLNACLLNDNPVKIVALVRNRQKAEKKFYALLEDVNFSLIVADVSDFTSYGGKIDVIIHAASQASPKYYGTDPVGTLKANTLGTLNLLDVARKTKCQRFLFVSSGEVYGVLDGTKENIDESYTGNVDCTNVRSCYAESKRMGETMCVCYSQQYGIHVNMVRLGHTYGPGCDLNDGRVFADFARNIVHGENIKVNSDGSAKRCFLYVTDMVKGLFYVLLKGENRAAYNINSSKETSIKDLAEMLCSLFSEKGLHAEFRAAKNDNSYIRSQSKGACLCNARLKSLGWEETVPIAVGFKRMIESYDL